MWQNDKNKMITMHVIYYQRINALQILLAFSSPLAKNDRRLHPNRFEFTMKRVCLSVNSNRESNFRKSLQGFYFRHFCWFKKKTPYFITEVLGLLKGLSMYCSVDSSYWVLPPLAWSICILTLWREGDQLGCVSWQEVVRILCCTVM